MRIREFKAAARTALLGILLALAAAVVSPLAAQEADVPEVVKPLLQDGDRFRQAGRLEEAIHTYEEALRIDPSVVAAYVSLGALYHGQGDFEKALEIFAAGLEHDPEQPNLLFNAAVLSRRLGRFENALGFVDRALGKSRRDANLHALRSATLKDLDRLQEALAAQEMAVRLDQGNPQMLYRLGNLYFDLGEKDKAINAYRKATRKDKGYLLAWYNLGAVLFDVARYDEALEAYLIALEPVQKAFASGEEVDPQNARAFLNLGAIYFQKEDWDAALDAYGKALRLDDEQAIAYYNRGYIYYQRGQAKEASKAYRRALELDPSLPLAYLHLGEISLRRGAFAEAISLTEKALDKFDEVDQVAARMTLAEAHLALNQEERAEEALRTILRSDRENLRALTLLGRLLRQKGDSAASREFLERARGLAPDDAGVALELAGLAREAGDLDRERALYGEILRRFGKEPAMWPVRVNLARLLVEKGDHIAARQAFEPVIARLSELSREGLGQREALLLATVHGLLLASEGKLEQARQRLLSVLETDASFAPAKDAVAVLDAFAGRPEAAARTLESTFPTHLGQVLEETARVNLAHAMWLAGRGEEAQDHLAKAAAAFPEYAGLKIALGEIAYRSRELPQALDSLSQAVIQCEAAVTERAAGGRELRVLLGSASSKPLCERARKSLGTVLVSAAFDELEKSRAGRRSLSAARSYAERALALPLTSEESSIAYLVRGTAQLFSNADREAKSDLSRALDALPAPLVPLARNNLGIASYRLGEIDAAQRQFEALTSAGSAPEATLNLGILLDERTGDKARALELYEAYLRGDGRRGSEVRTWVERLKKVYR